MTKPLEPPVETPFFETGLKLDIRMQNCGRYPCAPSWAIPPMRVQAGMVSFFFVEKNGCWVVVNGRREVLKAGDLLVVRSRDELEMGHDAALPLTALNMMISVGQPGVSNVLLDRKFPRRHRVRSPRELVARFEAIFAAIQRPVETRGWAIAGSLLQCLAYLVEETRAPLGPHHAIEDTAVDKILAAQHWALQRLNSRIVLAEWARVVKLHPVYFERIFKRATGLTPKLWLQEHRLDTARQYLCGTGKSISEISDLLGYTNQFYFSRVFRKHFKKSPSQYRRSGMVF